MNERQRHGLFRLLNDVGDVNPRVARLHDDDPVRRPCARAAGSRSFGMRSRRRSSSAGWVVRSSERPMRSQGNGRLASARVNDLRRTERRFWTSIRATISKQR